MSCPRLKDLSSETSSMSTITSTEPSLPSAHCPAKQSPILLAKLQGCPMGYHRQKPIQSQSMHRSSNSSAEDENTGQCHQTLTHPNIPAGTTITAVTRPVQPINRKLDSPTDSGIESGSDGSSVGKIGSGSSSCSSPRSSLEDGPIATSLADTLPTLKRALEKPAIFDPHMYHKKFRRVPAVGELYENQSQLQTILTSARPLSNGNEGSLAMTHSILAGTLKTAPKMSEEHRKNQEILNRFIDQGGVIKSSKEVMAKVQIASVDNEGTPLNLSKKTSSICDEIRDLVEA
jgi:nuclear receptor subfamily 1 group D member 3